ncbi:MAG: L,D-transpeptidase, partial [Thermodesulfobacteriota bacterium]
NQTMYTYISSNIHTYPVSTATAGVGAVSESMKTPPGLHEIKIGGGAAPGTVFTGRRQTGQICEIITNETRSTNDFVTTRILWLSGLEPGVNSGFGHDTFRRCIYIHGTQEEGFIGKPVSHGCIRMKNQDIIVIYDELPSGTLVLIAEHP